jgi:hypothetical protein
MPIQAVGPGSRMPGSSLHPAIRSLEASWQAFRQSSLCPLLEDALACQAQAPVPGTPPVVLSAQVARAVSLSWLVGEPPVSLAQRRALQAAVTPVGATLATWASYRAGKTVILASSVVWSVLDTPAWLERAVAQIAPPLSLLIAVVPGETGIHYLGIRHDLAADLPALYIQKLDPAAHALPGLDCTLPNRWETLLTVPLAHSPGQAIRELSEYLGPQASRRPGTRRKQHGPAGTQPKDWVRWLDHHGVGLVLNLLAYLRQFPRHVRRLPPPSPQGLADLPRHLDDRPPSIYLVHPTGALRRDH